MVLGVYIYRASIVLIGAFSLFVILLFIEVPFVFERGVSDDILGNVMILTVICSFFGGYVAAYFPKVGLSVLGSWLGIILSLTLNNIAFYYIPSDPANLTLWIVMPILAMAFGIIALCVKKTFIIFSTCKIFHIFSLNRGLLMLEGFELASRSISKLIPFSKKLPTWFSWSSLVAVLLILYLPFDSHCFFIRSAVLVVQQKK